MGRLIIDAATSVDGYMADGCGERVFPSDDTERARMVRQVAENCGAVVLSRRSFLMAADPAWYAHAYDFQVPLFVFDPEPEVEQPALLSQLNHQFCGSFAEAYAAAQEAAGERAVIVLAEPGAMRMALDSGLADEIWLRVVSCTLGHGARLEENAMPGADYFVSEVEATADSVHMHLRRRTPH